jgi:acetyl esterase
MGWFFSRLRRTTGLAVATLLALVVVGGTTVATASTASAVTETRDIPYRTVDGVTLALDAYAPQHGPSPAVLLIHGGGWSAGDKSREAAIARSLAEHGFAVFAANYRLAPPGGTWHFPAPVDDLRAAMVWIREHGAGYGADASRVGAMGDSAGANLAMMLGVAGTPGKEKADVVVSWSGPTDFTTLNDISGSFVNYIGCALDACPDQWAAASPIRQVDAGDAPVFLANSTDEIVDVKQATAMAQTLAEVGVPSEVVILSGKRHAKEYTADVQEDSIGFLRAYLSRGG